MIHVQEKGLVCAGVSHMALCVVLLVQLTHTPLVIFIAAFMLILGGGCLIAGVYQQLRDRPPSDAC